LAYEGAVRTKKDQLCFGIRKKRGKIYKILQQDSGPVYCRFPEQVKNLSDRRKSKFHTGETPYQTQRTAERSAYNE